MDSLRRVSDWDEARDPANGVRFAPRWRRLRGADRQLLEALAEGGWMNERELRRRLGWGRAAFFVATLRVVAFGWVEARRVPGTLIQSDYRLSAKAWGEP